MVGVTYLRIGQVLVPTVGEDSPRLLIFKAGVSIGVTVGVSVGVGVGVGVEVGVGVGVRVHAIGVIVLVSSVTAQSDETPRAKALPFTVAPVFNVILSVAIIVPTNEVVVSRVAELPTCQNTLQPGPEPPLIKVTDEPGWVMSVVPVLKIQTAFGSPRALRVSVPVNPAEESKQ